MPITDPRRTATGMLSRVVARTRLLTKPASRPFKPECSHLDLLNRALIFAAFTCFIESVACHSHYLFWNLAIVVT